MQTSMQHNANNAQNLCVRFNQAASLCVRYKLQAAIEQHNICDRHKMRKHAKQNKCVSMNDTNATALNAHTIVIKTLKHKKRIHHMIAGLPVRPSTPTADAPYFIR